MTPSNEVVGWHAVLERCSDLLPLFERCELRLRATEVAQAMGLRSCAALHQLLAIRRLPPFSALRDWYYVVVLVDKFGLHKTTSGLGTLSAYVLQRGEDPRMYYRLVKRTTGHRWGEVQQLGVEWVRHTALQVWSPHL